MFTSICLCYCTVWRTDILNQIVKSKKIEVADVVYINEWKIIMLLIACL